MSTTTRGTLGLMAFPVVIAVMGSFMAAPIQRSLAAGDTYDTSELFPDALNKGSRVLDPEMTGPPNAAAQRAVLEAPAHIVVTDQRMAQEIGKLQGIIYADNMPPQRVPVVAAPPPAVRDSRLDRMPDSGRRPGSIDVRLAAAENGAPPGPQRIVNGE